MQNKDTAVQEAPMTQIAMPKEKIDTLMQKGMTASKALIKADATFTNVNQKLAFGIISSIVTEGTELEEVMELNQTFLVDTDDFCKLTKAMQESFNANKLKIGSTLLPVSYEVAKALIEARFSSMDVKDDQKAVFNKLRSGVYTTAKNIYKKLGLISEEPADDDADLYKMSDEYADYISGQLNEIVVHLNANLPSGDKLSKEWLIKAIASCETQLLDI